MVDVYFFKQHPSDQQAWAQILCNECYSGPALLPDQAQYPPGPSCLYLGYSLLQALVYLQIMLSEAQDCCLIFIEPSNLLKLISG